MGWVPARETTYVRTGNKVTGTTEWVESEWSEHERDLMVALRLYEAGLCPRCAHPQADAWDGANEGKYEPEPPTRCHACDASIRSQEIHADKPRAQALIHMAVLKR